jgi:flagellar protein FlaF
MLNQTQAIQAYKAASRFRSQREQEAEIFLQVNAALAAAKDGPPIKRVRALADNRRLWITVCDLMRDPTNQLPASLRADITSVGMTVQREMDKESPDLGFLIAINENIAAGLSGNP